MCHISSVSIQVRKRSIRNFKTEMFRFVRNVLEYQIYNTIYKNCRVNVSLKKFFAWYDMDNDVFRKKFAITHWCVTRLERVNFFDTYTLKCSRRHKHATDIDMYVVPKKNEKPKVDKFHSIKILKMFSWSYMRSDKFIMSQNINHTHSSRKDYKSFMCVFTRNENKFMKYKDDKVIWYGL